MFLTRVRRAGANNLRIVVLRRALFSTAPSDPNAAKSDKDAERAKVLSERERLKKELGKMALGGALYDVRAAAKSEEAKVFPTEVLADGMVIPESLRKLRVLSGKELAFPSTSRPSVLLLAFNQLGWGMLDGWAAMLPGSQILTIRMSVVEGMMSNLMHGWISSSLKKSLGPELVDNVVLRTGSFVDEKIQLGIDNKAVGYFFLFGPNGKVAIRGSGLCSTNDKVLVDDYLRNKRWS